MQGVFLDRDTVDRGDLDFGALESVISEWRFHGISRPSDLRERLADAAIAITNKVKLDADAFALAPKLRLICVAATGTNNVDLEAARRHGVTVSNVRGYATPSVTQHTFALMLSLSIHLGQYRRAVMKGEWQRSPYFCLLDFPIRELSGLTLGIVGYGELGREVARLAEAFGMKVLIAQRAGATHLGRLPLHELLPQVDVLSLHCPLTPETRNLIGTKELALMKPDSLLINTARGGIVDEQALANALREGKLGGAGIDVLSEEPPLRSNPLLDDDIPNLILTPHIAWASRESRQRLVNEMALNIAAFLAGTPRNSVTA